MSGFSRSSNGRTYKNGNYGSSHYQKKGFFGNMFNAFGSGSNSGIGRSRRHAPNPTPNQWQAIPQPGMTCKSCNAQIPAGSKFCLECGSKVSDSLFCMNCGEKLPPNAKFCLKCGTKL